MLQIFLQYNMLRYNYIFVLILLLFLAFTTYECHLFSKPFMLRLILNVTSLFDVAVCAVQRQYNYFLENIRSVEALILDLTEIIGIAEVFA